MNNLKANAITAKNKLETVPMRAKATVLCVLASVCPVYCDINGNSAMRKFLKIMFSTTVSAGIVLIEAGAV